jgi:hypothetical protein
MRSASEAASSANFDAAYSPLPGSAKRPRMLETFTMRPAPRWRIGGRKARVMARAPNRLTSNWARVWGSGTASTGPRTRIPAALTSTSSPCPPVSAVIWSRARAMAAGSVTSRTTGRTPGWVAARAVRASARRAAANTR